MQTSAPSSSLRRLPGRTRRQRLVVAGIALAICLAFWTAIYTANHDPDPRLYERLVPVRIIPTPPTADAAQPPAGKAPPAAGGQSASSTTR